MLTLVERNGMITRAMLVDEKAGYLVTDIVVFDEVDRQKMFTLINNDIKSILKSKNGALEIDGVNVYRRLKDNGKDNAYIMSNKTKCWATDLTEHTLYISNEVLNFELKGYTKFVDQVLEVYNSNTIDYTKEVFIFNIHNKSKQLFRDWKEQQGERNINLNFIYNNKDFNNFVNDINDFKKEFDKLHKQELKDFETFKETQKNDNFWLGK